MAVQILKERYSSQVGAVKLGATAEEGGTRGVSYMVGGEGALPFQHYEGEIPNRPIVAMEVNSMDPNWNENLKNALDVDLSDPVAWAKYNKECGADAIYLKLDSADPDNGGDSPEKCAEIVKAVLDAVDLPMIVAGCGNAEVDEEVLMKVAEVTKGENLLIGEADTEHYKTLVAACVGNGHSVIAKSPLDINICKQLNILITEMNMPADKIVIDPLVSSVGYGIEYAYSIMERGRMGALQGDKMLSMPIIAAVGFESWRQKEAWGSTEDFPAWGEQADRGPAWEATTAAACLQAGTDILLMRHPAAVKAIKKHIDALMTK
ncbi:MAG: acetyl-CoA decarbonylase/synthase complex subunit delta [Bacillota bacterium]|nr:acetyl-CoA decarbonylase/synthase complex subunit delta [Bacillota bacterium]